MRKTLTPGAVCCLLAAVTTIYKVAAAPITFSIDPQSKITISGNVAGIPLQEQGAGSLTTTFSGSIIADVTGWSIKFTGGSQIDARTNGVWEPLPGGGPGSAPADFRALATTPFGAANGAFRNLLLDVTSSVLTLNNGNFDSAALAFGFLAESSSTFDYSAGLLGSGSRTLSGLATNRVTSGATLTSVGGADTLTIKIDTEFKFRAISEDDSTARLAGQLVASRAVLPVISSIVFRDQTLVIRVEGTGGQPYRLQSSTNLRAWSPRAADVTMESNQQVFSARPSGALEFFRLSQ